MRLNLRCGKGGSARLVGVRRQQPIPDEANFRTWLAEKRGLKGRSLGDVISRLRRVAAWLDLLDSRSDAELTFWLTQDPRFEECTPNVKSQIKRALAYFRSFHRQTLGTP